MTTTKLTAVQTINQIVNNVGYSDHWTRLHSNTWRNVNNPFKLMVYGIANYIDTDQARYDRQIGNDPIIGDDGIRDMLRSLKVLFDGETHGLDCGILSTMVCELFKVCGYDDEGNDVK